MKELAVVLLSGGMDSAVCAALAQRDSYEIAALHLNYGQRTQQKEPGSSFYNIPITNS